MKQKVDIEVTVTDENEVVVETSGGDGTIIINAEECRCLITLLYSAEFEMNARKRRAQTRIDEIIEEGVP